MASQRLKGQEVEVLLVVDGKVQETTTDVRSFEVAAKTELKEEGYLGEKTNRYDDIFNGVRGSIEFHYENKDVFNVMKAIIDRSKRRTPGSQVNIKATLNFPGGDRPKILISDAFFGEIPFSFGSRSDYGTMRLEFSASDVSVL